MVSFSSLVGTGTSAAGDPASRRADNLIASAPVHNTGMRRAYSNSYYRAFAIRDSRLAISRSRQIHSANDESTRPKFALDKASRPARFAEVFMMLAINDGLKLPKTNGESNKYAAPSIAFHGAGC
jgi:hypothetical protein